MPLNTMRMRKSTKKDGRKRTSSTVSNVTTNSQTGSVGSPKSPNLSHSPPQRTNVSKNVEKPLAAPIPPTQSTEPTKKVPNVFEFLEDSDASSASSSSSSSSESSDSEDDEPLPTARTAATKIQSPKPRASPVPHAILASKAGTSPKLSAPPQRGSSRNPSDPRPPPAPSPPSAAQATQMVPRKQVSPAQKPAPKEYNRSAAESPPPGKRQLQISRPEDYYSKEVATIHRPLPPSPPSSPEDSIHRALQRRESNASQVSSGYGLVASHLTRSASEDKGAFPPMYRRFESLNHRVLLHLQDEISQMEEDLQLLDEYEEIERAATAEKEGNKPAPASRRVAVQSQSFSSMHYRRMDLMAALIHKTEQYSMFPLPNQPHLDLSNNI